MTAMGFLISFPVLFVSNFSWTPYRSGMVLNSLHV